MNELDALLKLAEYNIGAFAILVIFLIIRYQDRQGVRQTETIKRDDKTEQAIIDVLQRLVINFGTTFDKINATLDAHSASVRQLVDSLKAHDARTDKDDHNVAELTSQIKTHVEENRTMIDAVPSKVVMLMSEELDKLRADIPPLVVNGVKTEIDRLRSDYEASNTRIMVLLDNLKSEWSATIVETLRADIHAQTEISKTILAKLDQLTAPPAPVPGEHREAPQQEETSPHEQP